MSKVDNNTRTKCTAMTSLFLGRGDWLLFISSREIKSLIVQRDR